MRKYLLIILVIYLTIQFTPTIHEEGRVQPFFCDETECKDIIKQMISKNDSTCVFYEIDPHYAEEIQKQTNLYVYKESYEGIGEPVRNDEGLMHHKYCTIEPNWVITGSYNPTTTGHRDNLIVIESETLKNNYEEETKRLHDGANPSYQTRFTHNGYDVENYFCAIHDCQQEVIEEIQTAKKRIDFLTFTFTDEEIAEALQNKAPHVELSGIIEQFQNHEYWVYPMLQDYNLTLHDEDQFQHNKLFIIDNTTILGSYNPTWSANNKNDENILIINDPNITREYKKYYKRTWTDVLN